MVRQGRRSSRWLIATALLCGTALGWRYAGAAGFFGRDNRTKSPQATQGAKPSSLPPGIVPAPPASREPLPRGNQAAPVATGQAAATSDPLMLLVDRAIAQNSRRFLDVTPGSAQQNSPWQIMHGILAYRNEFQLKINDPAGPRKISAIQYISNEATYRNEHWFEATPYGGRAHPFNVPYWFEGHVNQFLAILTMSNLPLNHEFKVAGGKVVTMADMVRHAQRTTSGNVEVSWTLWFLTHYLDPDAEWTNMHGQKWSLATLAEIQTADGVLDAPCGGTHGLFALAYARNSYLQKHGELRGAWLPAHQKIEQYIQHARNVQNQDGSFSTKFYRQREFSFDFAERIRSSGHMLEWLMMGLPASRLQEPWVQNAVRSLATDLTTTVNQTIDPGPLYHACHALVLYRQRTQPNTPLPIAVPSKAAPQPDAPRPTQTAERPANPTRTISSGTAIPGPLLKDTSLPNVVLPEPAPPAKLSPVPATSPAAGSPATPAPVATVPATEPSSSPTATALRPLRPVETGPEPTVPPPPPLPTLVGEEAERPIVPKMAVDSEVSGASATIIAPPRRRLTPIDGRPIPMPAPRVPEPQTLAPAAPLLPEPIELPPSPPKVD